MGRRNRICDSGVRLWASAFGDIGRQIFDASVVIASGVIGVQQNGVEGFVGGIVGSGLVTGTYALANQTRAPPAGEAETPRGFWETVIDVWAFLATLKEFNEHRNLANGLLVIADGLALLAPGVPAGAGFVARAAGKADNAAGKGGTEVVERWMSKAELKATEDSGFIRGGKVGSIDDPHYVTDSANSNALRARQRLSLKQTPEVRVRLEVPEGSFSGPSKVSPEYGMPGGGMERVGYGRIPARVIKK